PLSASSQTSRAIPRQYPEGFRISSPSAIFLAIRSNTSSARSSAERHARALKNRFSLSLRASYFSPARSRSASRSSSSRSKASGVNSEFLFVGETGFMQLSSRGTELYFRRRGSLAARG